MTTRQTRTDGLVGLKLVLPDTSIIPRVVLPLRDRTAESEQHGSAPLWIRWEKSTDTEVSSLIILKDSVGMPSDRNEMGVGDRCKGALGAWEKLWDKAKSDPLMEENPDLAAGWAKTIHDVLKFQKKEAESWIVNESTRWYWSRFMAGDATLKLHPETTPLLLATMWSGALQLLDDSAAVLNAGDEVSLFLNTLQQGGYTLKSNESDVYSTWMEEREKATRLVVAKRRKIDELFQSLVDSTMSMLEDDDDEDPPLTPEEQQEYGEHINEVRQQVERARELVSTYSARELNTTSCRLLELSREGWDSSDKEDIFSAIQAFDTEDALIHALGKTPWEQFCQQAREDALAASFSKTTVSSRGANRVKGKGKKKRSGRSARTVEQGGEGDDSRIETPSDLPHHKVPRYQVFVKQDEEVSAEVRQAMRERDNMFESLIGHHGQIAGSERAKDMVEEGRPRNQGKGRKQRGRRATGPADDGPE